MIETEQTLDELVARTHRAEDSNRKLIAALKIAERLVIDMAGRSVWEHGNRASDIGIIRETLAEATPMEARNEIKINQPR